MVVCVWERERERQRQTERERDRERDRVRKELLWSTLYCDTSPKIDIFRALLHRASFMGDWYRASCQPADPHPHHQASIQDDVTSLLYWLLFPSANPDWPLGSKTPVIIYFPDAYTFLPAQFAIHVAFPLSFSYLKTKLHILFFEIHTNWPVKGQYVRKWFYFNHS